jgi:hypothetical protein
VAAWGDNHDGQLGNNTTTSQSVPVAVNTHSGVSALFGRTVASLTAGSVHSGALCSDGTLVTWGGNLYGQLGDSSTNAHLVPVMVNKTSGVSALYGKTVTAIAAGGWHTLALCSDGTLAAWGNDNYGQLGDAYRSQRSVPGAVRTNSGVSALYGRRVVTMAAGANHSLALCADSTVAAWGDNASGQLGDNTTSTRDVPVLAMTSPLASSQRFARIASGCLAGHTLALIAAPPASAITLTGPRMLSNRTSQFAFTNTPGAFFGVLAATNPALPLGNWTSLTALTEVSPGQFQFTDPQATTNQQRFYRIHSP